MVIVLMVSSEAVLLAQEGSIPFNRPDFLREVFMRKPRDKLD
jgi:hypothetical protein